MSVLYLRLRLSEYLVSFYYGEENINDMKNILVPFDFSDSSKNALEYAYFLAEKLESQITVLFVLTVFSDIYDGDEHLLAIKESILAVEKEHKIKLDSHIKKNDLKAIGIQTEIIKSTSVPAGILEFIDSGNFDLIVLGASGKTGISERFMGSISGKIIKLSPVPVLTIHKDWLKRELKTMLSPVDFSEGSRFAAKKAKELFAEHHPIHKFIFVIEEDEYPEIFSIRFHFENQENLAFKNKILDTLAEFTGIPLDHAEYIIRAGRAHDEIKEFAEEQSIDLIIMPKTGQSLFEKILIGSTTERTIRVSPCPVLTIPFSAKNTSKSNYHLKFIQFLATHKLGMGRIDVE